MMTPRLAVALLCVVAACDTVEFQRDNPRDPGGPGFIPLPPDGLEAVAEEDAVALRWRDHTEFEDGYVVERSFGSGAFEELAVLPPAATVYRDTSAIRAVPARYRVAAFKQVAGQRSASSADTTTVDLGMVSEIEAGREGQGILLSWTDGVKREHGYSVEVSLGGSYETVALLPPNATTYHDTLTTFTFGAGATYRVRAFVADGTTRSFIHTMAYEVDVREVFAPGNVTFEIRDEETVEVRWEDGSNFEHGFQIERDAGNGWRPVADVEADQTSYIHRDLLEDQAFYRYRVRAFGPRPPGFALRESSEFATGLPVRFLITTPGVTSISSRERNRVSLLWEHDEPLAAGYIIERSSVWQGPFSEVVRLPASARSYDDHVDGTSDYYNYRVRTLASFPHYVNTRFLPGFKAEQTLKGHDKGVYRIVYSPDGSMLATSSGYLYGEAHVNLWDAATGALLRRLEHAGHVTSIAFSPDGNQLAVGASAGDFHGLRLHVWDVGSGELVFGEEEGVAYDVAFSPDGSLVTVIGAQGSVWAWHVGNWSRAYHINMVESSAWQPQGLSFSRDGGILATTGSGPDILLRNATTGKEIRRIRASLQYLFSVSISPDGNTIAAGGRCSPHGAPHETAMHGLGAAPRIDKFSGCMLDFSPDGNRYATGVGYLGTAGIYLWSMESGERLAFTPGVSAAFSPNADRLAIGLDDGTVEIRSPDVPQWMLTP